MVLQRTNSFLFCFLRPGFTVVVEPVRELGLVDQTGLKLRDLPATVSQVLGLKACATTAQLESQYLFELFTNS